MRICIQRCFHLFMSKAFCNLQWSHPISTSILAWECRIKSKRLDFIRHSHASLLIHMGESPLLLKERLGHEKIQTTLGTYGHLYPNTNLEVAKKLTGVLNIREQSERHPQPAHGEVPFSKWKSGIETRKGCPPHHGRTPKSIMRNALRL